MFFKKMIAQDQANPCALACLIFLAAQIFTGRAFAVNAPTLATAQLSEVVITATRLREDKAVINADVTVIDAQQIQAARGQTLAELLQNQPGIEMATSGGPQTQTSIFTRGTNSGHTILLIDGLRIGSSSSGSVNWQAIPLAQIERIEILRGPASSLYGADAIGGVVQIFTKRPASGATSGYLEARAGSWNTAYGELGASTAYENMDVRVDAAQGRSAGYDVKHDNPNPDRDGYNLGKISTSLGWKIDANNQLRFQAAANRLVSETDGYEASPARETTTTNTDWWGLQSQHHLGKTNLRTLIGSTTDESVSRPENAKFSTRQRQIGIFADRTFAAAHTLSGGLEQRVELVDATSYPDAPKDRATASALLGYLYRAGGHRVQLNLRHDDASQYGSRVTGSASYGYDFLQNWRVYGSYGTAFRAPSFNDLYYPGWDNPNLQPEYAKNAELAIQYTQSKRQLRATAFENRISNLIGFSNPCSLSGREFGCPENIEQARIYGMSLVWEEWIAANTQFNASYDWQDPENLTTGKYLPRRAQQTMKLRLTHTWAKTILGSELIGVGPRFDDAANQHRLGGYALLNLSANYTLNTQLSLFMRFNNVFNKQYELVQGYQTPQRNLMAGIRASF